MVSNRLIRLIETHAADLSKSLAEQIRSHPRTPSFSRLPAAEVEQRLHNVYKNLGLWIMGTPEEEIRRTYEALGQRRHEEGIPLQEVIYALILNKNHLLNFAHSQGLGGTALEIYGEQELAHNVSRFYDGAIYYTAVGYNASLQKVSAA